MNNTSLSILQWNMGDSRHANKIRDKKKERAQILTDLLADYNPTVVTLQEASRDVLSYVDYRQYDLYDGPVGLATLVLRSTYKIYDNTPYNSRYQLLALDRLNNLEKGLKIINLHLPALWLSEDQKRTFLRMSMPDINKWRTEHEPRFEVMSGDFNIPPYDIVLMEETGIFSNRDLKHALAATNKYTYGFGRALYNTSWHIFGGNCGAPGTYYQNTLPHGPWYIPDQVLIDPKLVDDSQVHVTILTTANGSSLATPRSMAPNKDKASDHFPVLVSIQSNTVKKTV